MAPKKTDNAAPAIEIKDMNVWQKLQAVRMEFLAAGSKKSGKNLHAEFTYFELVDIVPQAEALFTKYHLSLIPSFGGDMAIADIVNTDDPQQRICFSIPIRFIAEPAKFRMNEVQGVGAVVTYYRRYLYMLVLDLVESDGFDGLPVPEEDEGQDTPSPKATETPKAIRPVTPAERKEITEQLTGSEEMASEEEISELKEKLKLLLELDPEQESFIQEIALKTNSFQEIKRVACLALTENVADMLDGYTSQEG